jgi:hypothetical protein
MKNIYVLPTDKPSRLYNCFSNLEIGEFVSTRDGLLVTNQNIYITSDEEIKEGDWFIHYSYGTTTLLKCKSINLKDIIDKEVIEYSEKKIILTTDQDLINDGVQAIDDEFLQWFIENQSCEKVEVVDLLAEQFGYIIIIPKEEPKQENKVLVEMQQILRRDSKFMGHYESCDLCHYNAFFKYLYNGEILYRCQGHKIVNINNLKSKFGFGSEEPEQEITLEDIFNEEKKQGVKELIDKHKQETLEEAAIIYAHKSFVWPLNKQGEKQSIPPGQSVPTGYTKHKKVTTKHFINGAKWQEQRMYSEEEVLSILRRFELTYDGGASNSKLGKWFEQFKKK